MNAKTPIADDPTSEFSDDPRFSFDTVSGKWHYETDDGIELEYDLVARAWVPVVLICLS